MLQRRAYARAGLIGNPSDGYGGKTISLTIPSLYADVVLYEWEELEVIPSQEDRGRFNSIVDLVRDVQLHGYYGGIRLVKATIKRFFDFCSGRFDLHQRNFSIRYETNIPRQVGLAGSSAIIVATLRALVDFYEVPIARHLQPSLALTVETEELGIAAGLQDRVVQVYEGLVAMDFTEQAMTEQDGLSYGSYEPLDMALLPPAYVAYSSDLGEPTEVTHNDLRSRYLQGDAELLAVMQELVDITDQARAALDSGDSSKLAELIDRNFALRQSICSVQPGHLAMIEAARSVGASAKFAGSGGAIIGLLPSEQAFAELASQMQKLGCQVLRTSPA